MVAVVSPAVSSVRTRRTVSTSCRADGRAHRPRYLGPTGRPAGAAALRPRPGGRPLVTGAAAAVGGLAVQPARRAGMAEDGLVSRPGHVKVAQELGVATVAYDPASLPRGAYDAVLDAAWADLSTGLTEDGRYVSVAGTPLPEVPNAAKSCVHERRSRDETPRHGSSPEKAVPLKGVEAPAGT